MVNIFFGDNLLELQINYTLQLLYLYYFLFIFDCKYLIMMVYKILLRVAVLLSASTACSKLEKNPPRYNRNPIK